MTAVLFGSISTLADTSEVQRTAFNEAFAEHGVDWHWDREECAALLETAGGRNRVAGYANEQSVITVMARAAGILLPELFAAGVSRALTRSV